MHAENAISEQRGHAGSRCHSYSVSTFTRFPVRNLEKGKNSACDGVSTIRSAVPGKIRRTLQPKCVTWPRTLSVCAFRPARLGGNSAESWGLMWSRTPLSAGIPGDQQQGSRKSRQRASEQSGAEGGRAEWPSESGMVDVEEGGKGLACACCLRPGGPAEGTNVSTPWAIRSRRPTTGLWCEAIGQGCWGKGSQLHGLPQGRLLKEADFQVVHGGPLSFQN